jgi:adenylate cyclase class 2
MAREVEIKLKLESVPAIRSRLAGLGFLELHERAFEANVVFDTPGSNLRNAGLLIRLRSWRGKYILTYKGPGQAGRHKSREEIETGIENHDHFEQILNRLGYRPMFRYEKFRTEFAQPGEHGLVTIDETPIGNYLELEGEPGWIDATALLLGYSEADYLTSSYNALFVAFRRENPASPQDMVFPDPRLD